MRISLLLIALTALGAFAWYHAQNGKQQLPTHLAQLLITAGLLHRLWLGRSWARWLTIISAFAAALMSLSYGQRWLWVCVPFAVAGALLLTPPAGRFLRRPNRPA